MKAINNNNAISLATGILTIVYHNYPDSYHYDLRNRYNRALSKPIISVFASVRQIRFNDLP
ncbi:MAG: hypothetical protein GQ533_02055 [Methanosarcinaceae archaeon]|nr:hypothetical protein [Methanosarcinaceae archaeon]